MVLHYSSVLAEVDFSRSIDLGRLPLFAPEKDTSSSLEEAVDRWRTEVRTADAIIISTPAYLYNIPAQLKNALEWLTTSGELHEKPVIAMTYTPHPPRGEKAMKSLLNSLGGLKSRVVCQCAFYQTELKVDDEKRLHGDESIAMLTEAIHLLV